MRTVKAGATDVSVIVRILDSTTFLPETGVTAATGGLTVTYRREGAAAVALTAISTPALSDLALLTTAHTDGGLLHIADGYYRVDIPDAAFAAGVDGVTITVTATGMVGVGCYVQLVGYDARTELTTAALANLDAAVSSRLAPTVAARTLDVTATGAAGVDWSNVEAPTTTVGLSGTTVKAVTDGVSLANDAITSAKFDESTAFPLKAADTGSTYVARTGADSDTLETLSDQIDGVDAAAIADAVWDEATAGHVAAGTFGAWAAAVTASLAAIVAAIAALPAAVWAYVTRTLTTVAVTSTSATGTTLDPIVAGTTYNATITGLTIPADWHKMRLTIKSSDALADDKSTLQLLETTPADAADGLLYLNGAATTAAYGSLTVDQVAGTAVIMLKPAATSQLARADCLGYDLMCLSGTDTQTQLTKGSVSVELTETKTIA